MDTKGTEQQGRSVLRTPHRAVLPGQVTTPLEGDRVAYTPTADENIRGGQCTFRLTVSGSKITVDRDGCLGFCGNGAWIGGVYERTHP